LYYLRGLKFWAIIIFFPAALSNQNWSKNALLFLNRLRAGDSKIPLTF